MFLLFTITIIYHLLSEGRCCSCDFQLFTPHQIAFNIVMHGKTGGLWCYPNWLPSCIARVWPHFFLSNKNGDLAGLFVVSRKDNICSSVYGPFSTKSQRQYPFINLIFLFYFLFALLVLKRLNKMAVTIIYISHQGSNCCWLPAKG